MSDTERWVNGVNPTASRWIFAGMIVLLVAAGLAVLVLQPGASPLPPEVANNPRLVAGRQIYCASCIGCHGEKGRGDGPLAKTLAGPPPRNLAEDEWKHGTRPAQVLTVLRQGVPGTAMGGWSPALNSEQIRSVAAYVYTIAGKPVPEELR